MIIDLILDRYDAETDGDFNYDAREFYYDALGYGRVGDGITAAMDYGTEDDVKKALINYIISNDYNLRVINYINERIWLENTDEIKPVISICDWGIKWS